MVLRSAVARVVLGLPKALRVSRVKAVVRGVGVEAAAAAVEAVVAEVEMVVEATVVAMPAVETEAGDAHVVKHFRYSTGPGAA